MSDCLKPVVASVEQTWTIATGNGLQVDQYLCLSLADPLRSLIGMLSDLRFQWPSPVLQKLFRELYRIVYRAEKLVNECCAENWLEITFKQACTSHKEEILDILRDLVWCLQDIGRNVQTPSREPCGKLADVLRSSRSSTNSLSRDEERDQRLLLAKLEGHMEAGLPGQELAGFLERLRVVLALKTAAATEFPLDLWRYDISGDGVPGKFLGKGSVGSVSQSEWLGIKCAKKVITCTDIKLNAFAKQAKKLAMLGHPHVMKLFGFYQDRRRNQAHFLMELMDRSLYDLIKRVWKSNAVSHTVRVDIMLQIAKGVCYLHENGIAHRDLKCANVLVNKAVTPAVEVLGTDDKDYVHVKVADFDLAKILTTTSSELLVQSKVNVGSTPWRAPEAYTLKDGAIHITSPTRADSYSFAMTCYELLSGKHPFEELPINWSSARKDIVKGTRPPLPEDCPVLLEHLLKECWRTDPSRRPDFPEICRRLLDVKSFLLTGSLTLYNRESGQPTMSSFIVGSFKRVQSAVTNFLTGKRECLASSKMRESQAAFKHMGNTTATHQHSEVSIPKKQGAPRSTSTKVLVGLDFGTTHTGVAYAMVSNPNEIFTVSNWPLVREENYLSKTLTAIFKPTPGGDCLWGYPARLDYEKALEGDRGDHAFGFYTRELKQYFLTCELGGSSTIRQLAVDYLRELGKYVLQHLQNQYREEMLEMDMVRWCVTVPCNWSDDAKQEMANCMVSAGLLLNTRRAPLFMFLEPKAAACYCHKFFAHANMRKGDELLVVDVGGGAIQFIVEEWGNDDECSYEATKKSCGSSAICIESLLETNFLKVISSKFEWYQDCVREFPSINADLLREFEKFQMGCYPDFVMIPRLLEEYRGLRDPNDKTYAYLELSSGDIKAIFDPFVHQVVTLLHEQLDSHKNIKVLFVVGGFAKLGHIMEAIRKQFKHVKIITPRNPGSAVCEGGVILGLSCYFQEADMEEGSSSNTEGGGAASMDDGETRHGDKHGSGQPGSSQKYNPAFRQNPTSGNTNTKGKQQMDGVRTTSALPEKIVVGLDFGTTHMGFAYTLESPREFIIHCKIDRRETTALYYKFHRDGLQFQSWGEQAKHDCKEDWLQQLSIGEEFVSDRPDCGAFLTRVKLHLANNDTGTAPALDLPSGLSIEDVISACLRQCGTSILVYLQEQYGEELTMDSIQWCVTIPSIWDDNAKQRTRACILNAGLVRGPNSVIGSPFPLITVLEPEAAAIGCASILGLKCGDKVLVASSGGGIIDVVVEEWISDSNVFKMKEVSRSLGGLCGSSYVDINFMLLLSSKIGPWLGGYLEQFPSVRNELLVIWESRKVRYRGHLRDGLSTLALPNELQSAWKDYEQRSGFHPRHSYMWLQLTNEDYKQIFDPVVDKNLELIQEQLSQNNDVKTIVVVGGFAKSPYLMSRINDTFGCKVDTIIRPDYPECVVSTGAVALALNPQAIVSRVARKTYGLGLNLDFEEGVCPAADTRVRNDRFRKDVERGEHVQVDFCVSSVHEPLSHGQETMKFTLYSSTEPYPRYTEEDSVSKEWDFVVDISDGIGLVDKPQVKLAIFYGRSSIEVEAIALNFGHDDMQLPVEFALGARNERRGLQGVARKTYGLGTNKCRDMWDPLEYGFNVDMWDPLEYVFHVNSMKDVVDKEKDVFHVVRSEDLSNRFEIYIQRGTPLDCFVSRTLFPVYSLQRTMELALYMYQKIQFQ